MTALGWKVLFLGIALGAFATLIGVYFGAEWAARMLSRLLGT